jgi:hypothetical protein
MGIRDEVLEYTQRRGDTCRMQFVLAKMGKAEKAELEEVVADASVPSTAIARYLQKQGFDIKEGTILRHRRGACACGH